MFADVPVTDAYAAPFRRTSYPVTPTLSVLGDQESVNAFCVMEDAASPDGTEGAVASGAAP
jgi:hypothetical protein